jgi:outer membrane biosynthesis protein TonB
VQPASTPAIPPPTPSATQTEKAAPARPANAPSTSPPVVDTGAGSKDASARPVASSKPEPTQSAAGPEDKTGSGADLEALQQAIRARSAQTDHCYEIALRDDPSLSGTVTLRIKVDSNGRVIDADASGLTEAVQTCLVTQVREIKFPKPAAVVSLTIPFRFEHE